MDTAVSAIEAKEQAPVELPADLQSFIDEWKDKPGNLIMILHRVQETFGYVPREVAFKVADILQIPPARVYGVLTFYHFFKLQKPGKYQFSVCLGTACYLKGGDDLLKELETQLGVGLGGVSEDGLFSLNAVRCVGCCGLAPVLSVNGEIHGTLKKADIAGIVAKYAAKG